MSRVAVLLAAAPSVTAKLTVRVAVAGLSEAFAYTTLRRAAW